MEIQLKIKKTFKVKTLKLDVEPRYWEDATVNGKEDTDGDLIPLRFGDSWKPIIEIDTGMILNWEFGNVADIHYKVCDAGIYSLCDEDGNLIVEKEGYVPSVLDLTREGYGDYIIMKIDENGQIQNWNNNRELDLEDFSEED